jgi:hypothetical protein
MAKKRRECPERRNHVCSCPDCPVENPPLKYRTLTEEFIKGRFQGEIVTSITIKPGLIHKGIFTPDSWKKQFQNGRFQGEISSIHERAPRNIIQLQRERLKASLLKEWINIPNTNQSLLGISFEDFLVRKIRSIQNGRFAKEVRS